MKDFLNYGSKWLSAKRKVNNLNKTLIFGNHKGASAKLELLLKLIGKDVKYGCSIPISLNSVKLIPGLEMALMNIMAQNTIDEFGRLIPKD
jgi:hypothetical protein